MPCLNGLRFDARMHRRRLFNNLPESPPGGSEMAIAKEKLQEWRRLKAESAELGRQKKTLDDRLEQLETEFEAELVASKKNSIIRHGFTLAWTKGKASVSWALEFLKECGPAKTQALKDQAAKAASKKLQISAPSE